MIDFVYYFANVFVSYFLVYICSMLRTYLKYLFWLSCFLIMLTVSMSVLFRNGFDIMLDIRAPVANPFVCMSLGYTKNNCSAEW